MPILTSFHIFYEVAYPPRHLELARLLPASLFIAKFISGKENVAAHILCKLGVENLDAVHVCLVHIVVVIVEFVRRVLVLVLVLHYWRLNILEKIKIHDRQVLLPIAEGIVAECVDEWHEQIHQGLLEQRSAAEHSMGVHYDPQKYLVWV